MTTEGKAVTPPEPVPADAKTPHQSGDGSAQRMAMPPLRGRSQALMESDENGRPIRVKGYHCIEIKVGRKWTLLGDDNGVYKFDSAEARDAKIRELQGHQPALTTRERNCMTKEQENQLLDDIARMPAFSYAKKRRAKAGSSSSAARGSVNAALAAVGEVGRATYKFPTWPTDPLHALAVLQEEVGELTKEVVQLTYEPHKTNMEAVRREAVQTAAMALRFLMSLDSYVFEAGAQHSQNQQIGDSEQINTND